MKKKIVTSIVAFCTVAATAVAFAGCAPQEDSSISKADFLKGFIQSYHNYSQKIEDSYEDIKAIGNMSLTYSYSYDESYQDDWTYTPDGAAQSITETYTSTYSGGYSSTVSTKVEGGNIYLSIRNESAYNYAEYNTSSSNDTAPLPCEKSISSEVSEWAFGVSEGIYYVRLTRSVATASSNTETPTLPTPTVTKEYTTFIDQSEYEYAVSYVLEHYHEQYISDTYDNGDFDITNNYSEEKYSKVGNTYNMKLSAAYASSYSSGIYVGDWTVEASYGENGIESYISSYTETDCIDTKSETNSVQVRYSSNVQTIASPFDGFTLNNSLNYSDACM